MSQLLIENVDIVTEKEIVEGHCLLIENGKIARIAPRSAPISTLSSCRRLDASDNYLCPGFIDLHIHGIHSYLVDNGPQDVAEICRVLPQYGVTGFLPTVSPLPKGQDAAFIKSLSAGQYAGSQILGFHLEGPYLSLTGALPPEALGDADINRVSNLKNAAKPYKSIFSISPEFERICDLLPTMTADNTPAFITHTKANVLQTLAAIQAGARHATHFYDVFYAPEMTEPGVRPCGAVEAILASPDVSVDFILDGVHVDPIAVKMALQCKGIDRVCLITDGNIGAGLGPGRYKRNRKSDIVVTVQGAPARQATSNMLAGSGLTMNLAVKNAVNMLNVDFPLAVKMASANPAAVLRCHSKGVIKEGFDADLVLMDKQLTVLQTWVNGQCCYEKQSESV